MKRFLLVISTGLAMSLSSRSQLYINKATFFIDQGAVVTVEGDVTSDTSILGSGKLHLNGNALQNVNMNNVNDAPTNGWTIPFLEINNAANVSLNTKAFIQDSISFVAGKISIGNNDITLSQNCKAKGMASGMFIETNGSGVCKRTVASDFSGLVMPVGLGTNYRPVKFTAAGNTYTNAFVSTKINTGASPNKHVRAETYLNIYWPVTKSGISGGTLNAVGTYIDPVPLPSEVTGTEADLAGTYFDGTNWTNGGGAQDAALNTVAANITGNSGHLYGQNLFLLANMKVFLQGCYNSGTGLMDDKLRHDPKPIVSGGDGPYAPGTLPAHNLLPPSDPYRAAPYNTTLFAHVNNNSNPESVANSVLQDQATASKNVVDWIFLELRNTNASPGNTVLETRSALLLRDGSIVDVDGVSPVYFNAKSSILGLNAVPGNYTLGIRHRNHLGIYTSNTNAFALAMDTISKGINFTILAAASIKGSSNNVSNNINLTNYYNNGTFNFLYAGNANGYANNIFNQVTKYSGPTNDPQQILTKLGGLAGSTSTGYFAEDVNMDRVVKYSGPSNDPLLILQNVLGSNAGQSRVEAVHN